MSKDDWLLPSSSSLEVETDIVVGELPMVNGVGSLAIHGGDAVDLQSHLPAFGGGRAETLGRASAAAPCHKALAVELKANSAPRPVDPDVRVGAEVATAAWRVSPPLDARITRSGRRPRVTRLRPGPFEVVIKVACERIVTGEDAWGPGPSDGLGMSTDVSDPSPLRWEGSGLVERVGECVTLFSPGDAVYGCCSVSDLRLSDSRLALAQDRLALKPLRLSLKQAAHVPAAVQIAWDALTAAAPVWNADVLIAGLRSPAVPWLVQLAKHKGAVAHVLCGPDQVRYVRAWGAHAVVVKDNDRLGADAEFQYIFHLGGDRACRELLPLLRRGGKLFSQASGTATSSELHVFPLHWRPASGVLCHVATLIDEGTLQLPRQLPLRLCPAPASSASDGIQERLPALRTRGR